MTVYDTNVRYTMFSMPLVHQYIFIVTVFWANKQAGSICSHTLTETLSQCASRHFQKFFQKRTNSNQAARSSTLGVAFVLSGLLVLGARVCDLLWGIVCPRKLLERESSRSRGDNNGLSSLFSAPSCIES